jgi:tripartite ATP-independent transporter DctM subunit
MIELSPLAVLLVVFAAILATVMAGMRIGFALLLIGVISLVVFPSRPMYQPMAETGWNVLNSFVLTAVPLFIFMGHVLARGRISEELYSATEKWLSRMPGGLANVNIASSAIFAALSGSSLATTAGIGSIAIPAMKSRGYHPRLIYGSLGAGGTLGILIPPSIPLIIYGFMANVSIGSLFIAGVIPGVLMALAFMLFIGFWALKNPSIVPPAEHAAGWGERLRALRTALPVLVLVTLVLGTIYAGVATPTEAAALGAFGAILITVFNRQFGWRMLKDSLFDSALTMGMIGLIMQGAMMIAWAFHMLQVPNHLTEAIGASGLNRYVILALIVLLLYVLGCFIDGMSILLILTPVLVPVMTAMQFDLVWFGIILVISIEVSLITPPVGMNLFILKGIAPDARMEDIIMGALPYVSILTLGIVVLAVWPELATWLPNAMMEK